MIQRKTWDKVKAAGLAKWDEGRKQTEKTYREWWHKSGNAKCSFCKYFHNGYNACSCPLINGDDCAKEFIGCLRAYINGDFPAFISAANALYHRIEALTYEDLPR
jgi:hypothetical protein